MSFPSCIRVRYRPGNVIYALPLSGVRTWEGLQESLAKLFPDHGRPFTVTVGSNKDVIHPNVWELFLTDMLLVEVQSPRSDRFTVSVEELLTHQLFTVFVSPRTTVKAVRAGVAQRLGKEPCSLRLLYDGCRPDNDLTMDDLEVEPNDTFNVTEEQRGGKPVITCYPITTTDLEVDLSLSNGLDFSYVHPLPEGALVSNIEVARNVSWKVTAKPNGELIDITTKREYAQLFWEAIQLKGPNALLPSPIDTSMADASRVFMTTPDLFPTFIDNLMIPLGFQVKERQEFVTYWGPQLLERPFILVKLLTPQEYAAAAALSVKPSPDRVVRLFAIFRGVDVPEMESEGLVAAASMETQASVLLGGRPAPRVGSPEDGFVAFEWGGMIA